MLEKLKEIEATLVAALEALENASEELPVFDWSSSVGLAYDAVAEALYLLDEVMEEYNATRH